MDELLSKERRLSEAEIRAALEEYAGSRDVGLRNRLVLHYESLAHFLARRFVAEYGLPLEDLRQVAVMGLIAALERYDPERGIGFSSYATPTILGVIKHYLRDHTWGLKAPRRLRELGMSAKKMRERLEAESGRAPTVAEVAAALDVPEERLLQAMDLDRYYQTLSLDAVPEDRDGEAGGSFWEQLGAPDPDLAELEHREMLRLALERLDERQRQIIHSRFFEEATQSEIAEWMGISQMHVSRLERQALRILRAVLLDRN